MKIIHCCLAQFYVDNFGYQENLLPKMHKIQGLEVEILASTETYIHSKLDYLEPNLYINEYGIPVTRVGYINYLPLQMVKKLRIYNGIRQKLEDFNPDIIFLHDVQFLSIVDVVRYVKKNPKVKLYADGHADFGNSAKNWVSKNLLHKILYKWCAKKIEPYALKFWGVTPLRVDFFKEVYGIDKGKVDLLVLGVDDTEIDFTKKNEIRSKIRKALNLEDKFVIISGGKIDARKKIEVLLEAVNQLEEDSVHLILFGSITEEMKIEINQLIKNPKIEYLGWLTPKTASEYFFAADLAFFPGTHSVLWEQSIGCGLPGVFRKWEGMQHVDIGGNCLFLDELSISKIQEIILKIVRDKDLYRTIKENAELKGPKMFSYTEIAKRAIQQ
jgi:glycosyltransferase involved in cell wall biosynthesis